MFLHSPILDSGLQELSIVVVLNLVLQESLRYFLNSFRCPQYVKRFGLLQELIAIDARYARHKKSWQEHLQKTKTTILAEAAKLDHREKILILGAGSLNDVPLAELSTLFKQVHLVDIFFLDTTRTKIKNYSNVTAHEIDLSASLEKLYKQYCQASDRELFMASHLQAESPNIFLNEKFDMVVSLNLLSQLPLAAKRFFDRKNIVSYDLDTLYQSLITNHLDYLQKFSAGNSQVLLITDIEKQIYQDGVQILVENTLQDLELNGVLREPKDTWIWNLAPRGELGSGFELHLKVKCGII